MTVLLVWVFVAFLVALVLGRAIRQSDCTEGSLAARLPQTEDLVSDPAGAAARPAVRATAPAA